MPELSKLFMYILGIILFLVGSGQVREWLRFHVFGRCMTAKVVSCNHVLKKGGNGCTSDPVGVGRKSGERNSGSKYCNRFAKCFISALGSMA